MTAAAGAAAAAAAAAAAVVGCTTKAGGVHPSVNVTFLLHQTLNQQTNPRTLQTQSPNGRLLQATAVAVPAMMPTLMHTAAAPQATAAPAPATSTRAGSLPHHQHRLLHTRSHTHSPLLPTPPRPSPDRSSGDKGIPKANVWLDPARLMDIDAGWKDKVAAALPHRHAVCVLVVI